MVGVAFLLWLTMAARPFAALTGRLALAVGCLGGYAVWALLSSGWSHAPSRAIVEFDRALLYTLTVALCALAFPGVQARRRMLYGVAAAGVVVTGAGLITRILPHVWPIAPDIQVSRLSYPLTYWNAAGLVATIAVLACVHLACSEREPRAVRVLGAACVPIPATALLFTFSRGAIAVLPVGLIAYLLLGRPRGAAGALLAIVPTAAGAVAVALGAGALSSDHPTSPLAVSQGHRVAIAVAVAIVAAALIRLATLPLDRRLAAVEVGPRAARRAWTISGVAVCLAVAIGLAAGGAGLIHRAAHQFATNNDVSNSAGANRLLNVGNNGRIEHWRVAVDHGFDPHPLIGTGAGTYQLLWQRWRSSDFQVVDAHSLYIGVLGELGIVGELLIVVAVLTLLWACARRARGPDRAVGAAAFGIMLAWALRAGIDWDWQMPAVTLPALAVGGAALGTAGAPRAVRAVVSPPPLARLVAGVGCLIVLVTPALVTISEHRLGQALTAFRSGNCPRAVDRALSASSALNVSADPFEVLGYCDARLGQPQLGVRAFQAAISRDRGDWELWYGLALDRALAGQDPRPAARAALERNPQSPLAQDAVRRFAHGGPRTWERRALGARLPVL